MKISSIVRFLVTGVCAGLFVTQLSAAATVTSPDRKVVVSVTDHGELNNSVTFDGGAWESLAADLDATLLATDAAEGFVRAITGPLARTETSKGRN